MRLLLLRHGRTAANEARLYCGFSDPPLSDRGRAELMELRVQARYPDVHNLLKLTSGMRRTDETLRLLFDAVPDARISEFREMNFGRFEMCSYEELKNDADYQAWIMDATGAVSTPEGESSHGFQRRVRSAAEALCRDTLLVAHGGVIAALMTHWFPEEKRTLYQWQPDFGQGYEVKIESGEHSYRAIPKKLNR